jgi:hypothetical protein
MGILLTFWPNMDNIINSPIKPTRSIKIATEQITLTMARGDITIQVDNVAGAAVKYNCLKTCGKMSHELWKRGVAA